MPEKKSLNDESLVNEHCDFTKNIVSANALLKLAVQFSFAQETETNKKSVDHSTVQCSGRLHYVESAVIYIQYRHKA